MHTSAMRGVFLRVIASKNRFVFGVYRRHMKTIGYLDQIDKLFGVLATTQNWKAVLAIVRILKG
jgi:ABC-type lipopolysaccharide export system ATPase subunit